MKRRFKVIAGAGGMLLVMAVLLFRPSAAQRAVEQTRRVLHQQGFKVEVGEFQLATSAEQRERATALTIAGRNSSDLEAIESPATMAPAVAGGRMPNSDQAATALNVRGGLWPALRVRLTEHRAALDRACAAALAGPIRFQLVPQADGTLPVSDLACMKFLAPALAARTGLELHDGSRSAAWTNLLALTRLVTAWTPEPREISHLVRFGFARLAQTTTSQALQAGIWTDSELAALQHEWESADFLGGVSETTAFSRANGILACQFERQQPLSGSTFPETGLVLLRYPRSLCADVAAYARQWRYRSHGTYEDENALMLYFQAREVEYRRASLLTCWSEIRSRSGATNFVPFRSTHRSRIEQLVNLKLGSLGFERPGQGMLERAADAEARRRLTVAALALARFRNRYGAYPQSLEELVPAYLPCSTVDFMDGKPLRYHRTREAQFLLYSVGLDCVDQGGLAGPRSLCEDAGTDLVWPCASILAPVAETRAETAYQ
jgi:hypothetical protein